MLVALEARELEVLCSLRAVETLRGVSCYNEMTRKEDSIRALAHLCKGQYYVAACKVCLILIQQENFNTCMSIKKCSYYFIVSRAHELEIHP